MMRHIARIESKAHVFNLVRTFDNENYLINLFERNTDKRLAHAVLRGLNIELDRIKATVSNEDIGRIRIQYFRDGLNTLLSATADDPAAQVEGMPIFDCLKETLGVFPNIDFRDSLHGLIDAREAYLQYPQFKSLPDLTTFVANVHRPLIHLHAGLHDVTDCYDVADSAAKAVGLAIILRAVPMHAQSRVSYMPRVDERGELSTRHLMSFNDESKGVFANVADAARTEVDGVQTAMKSMNRAKRKPFWPVLLADIYLKRLLMSDNNPFDERLMRSVRTTWHLNVQLRLLRARWFGS